MGLVDTFLYCTYTGMPVWVYIKKHFIIARDEYNKYNYIPY